MYGGNNINEGLRALLSELAAEWQGCPVYVVGSGLFAVERILASKGISDLHSNDTGLFPCAVGEYLAGRPFGLELFPDSPHAWMEPYLGAGVDSIAHLLLTMEYVKFDGRGEPFHVRMAKAYRSDWKRMHANTVERVKKALDGVALKSFTAGDGFEFARSAPESAVVVAIPAPRPTYDDAFRTIFTAPRPHGSELSRERHVELVPVLQEKASWVTTRLDDDQALKPFQIGSFQETNRSKVTRVYSGSRKTRVKTPSQNIEILANGRLSGEIDGDLRLCRLTVPQTNYLRCQYLKKGLAPGSSQLNIAVLVGDKIAGCCGFELGYKLGGWSDIYVMADLAIWPTIYKKLAKLVCAAILSAEMKAILEQHFTRRIHSIGTTAFTDKAVSMKYRGLFDVHGRGEGTVHYLATAGRWTLAESFEWWKKNHAQTFEAQ